MCTLYNVCGSLTYKPCGITIACELLGKPVARDPRLLQWIKMFEERIEEEE